MEYFYCARLNTFFIENFHPDIPDDIVPVSAERHMALTSSGFPFGPGDDGYPIQVAHPTRSEEQQAVAMRRRRDKLLSECDWTQMPDAQIDDAARSACRLYRQALRDIPEQAGWPFDFTWPEEPACLLAGSAS